MKMKTIFQCGILLSAVGALFGCGTAENYSKAVNSWNGASERVLFQTWGAPNETTQLPDGNTLYLYRSAEHESAPVMYTPTYARTSAQPGNAALLSQPPIVRNADHQTFYCDTWFEVNPDGMIVTTRFEGNNCVASKHHFRKISY